MCSEYKLRFDNFIVVGKISSVPHSTPCGWLAFITFEIYSSLFLCALNRQSQHKCTYVTYEFVFVILFALLHAAYVIRTSLETDLTSHFWRHIYEPYTRSFADDLGSQPTGRSTSWNRCHNRLQHRGPSQVQLNDSACFKSHVPFSNFMSSIWTLTPPHAPTQHSIWIRVQRSHHISHSKAYAARMNTRTSPRLLHICKMLVYLNNTIYLIKLFDNQTILIIFKFTFLKSFYLFSNI